MMKRQVFNPFLPNYEYIPDGEPHIFGNRVYLYGSHDAFNGASFCILDYVCYSAPIDDLTSWRYEGVIYKRNQDPQGKKGIFNAMYAPDVCKGKDGRYYLYYFLSYHGLISVAVSDTPAGQYQYLGHVKYIDGILLGKKHEPLQFDPAIFKDDDGKIYLYTGFSPLHYPSILLGGHKTSKLGPMVFELADDMLTIKNGPLYLGIPSQANGKGSEYEGHEFFEASSMRKYNGVYYFIYSSSQNHELCYAKSDNPTSGFTYGGTLISIGDVGLKGRKRKDALNYLGNTHGSILNIKDNYYIFYHRQTNRNSFSRQACAEKLTFKDGKFLQSEITSCGLNDKPLLGIGTYSSAIACNLYGKHGVYYCGAFKHKKQDYPYLTQLGKDRQDNPNQYIENIKNGAVISYKYFDLSKTNKLEINYKGKGEALLLIESNHKEVGKINIAKDKAITSASCQLTDLPCIGDITFKYIGKGKIDLISFKLS